MYNFINIGMKSDWVDCMAGIVAKLLLLLLHKTFDDGDDFDDDWAEAGRDGN
jgi:hypothetical protein